MSRFTEKIRENVQPHLQPGEQVQGALGGQSQPAGTPYFQAVVATDRRMLVFVSAAFRSAKVVTLMEDLPRKTQLGPVDARLWHRVQLGGEIVWVGRRHFKALRAIDEAAGFPSP